jgi:prolyl-tRNA editing enzyme YbaK/EbsC (Cys-tRNA(Pro) deacylase)
MPRMNAYDVIVSKLKECGVSYTLHSHELLLSSGDAYMRDNFEFDVDHGFKTLAFQVDELLVLVVIHGRDKVDYKIICEILGTNRKNLKTAGSEFLLDLGYSPGGISPIPVTGNTKVIADSSVLDYEQIVCGSGDGTKSIEINSKDLLAITNAVVRKIAKKQADKS